MESQRHTSDSRHDRSRRRRRLRRRRLIALVVLVLVAAAVVVAVVLVTGDAGGSGTAPSSSGTSTAASSSSASRTPKPTAPPPKVWEASTSSPVRVWVGGDSMGGELGWGLGPMLEKTRVLRPILYYKDSTGICRWDFYDWGDKIASVMKNDKPDAVVLMMGTNDTQSVWQNGTWIAHSDPDWKRVYQKRVVDMTRTAIKGGARRVYWVGMPIMAEGWRNPWMKSINTMEQKAVAQVPGARYIDSWSLFVDDNGKFVPSLRLADGVHFTVKGQQLLGKAVFKAIKQDWLPSGVPAPAPEASPSASASSI